MAVRTGVVTASEFGQIVDTKFEMRTGEMVKTYMHKKLAEKILIICIGEELTDVRNLANQILRVRDGEARAKLAEQIVEELELITNPKREAEVAPPSAMI